MTAVDDLTELVERAAAAEKVVLASKWREQSDVQVPLDRARKSAAEQRHEMSLDTDPIGCFRAGRACGRHTSTSDRSPRYPGRKPQRLTGVVPSALVALHLQHLVR
jgi:hypothetical protein